MMKPSKGLCSSVCQIPYFQQRKAVTVACFTVRPYFFCVKNGGASTTKGAKDFVLGLKTWWCCSRIDRQTDEDLLFEHQTLQPTWGRNSRSIIVDYHGFLCGFPKYVG